LQDKIASIRVKKISVYKGQVNPGLLSLTKEIGKPQLEMLFGNSQYKIYIYTGTAHIFVITGPDLYK